MERLTKESLDGSIHSPDLDRNYFFSGETNEDGLIYPPSSEEGPGGIPPKDDYNEGLVSDNGGRRSHRSSISSIPGSVVVHPRTDMHHHGENDLLPGSLAGGASGLNKKNKPHPFITHVRDRESPFRHPSSVRAMQMGDEDSELDALSPSSMTLKARKQRGPFRGQSPCISEMSMPMRSGTASPSSSAKKYYRSPHTRSPQMIVQEGVRKDYPLVLLHCNLLAPSLSLPPRLGTPSPELLREVLPDVYWRRWKLLEDKVVGSGVLRDRGVLISHPQEAYDVLEERLLESLELIRPRLAYGHFFGSEDGKGSSGDNDSDEESECVIDAGEGAKCRDCGHTVLKNPEGGERKWEVRIYAANGLMRAGAWAAAWKDMEKVDVEVGLWLPVDIRRDLERRMLEEEAFRMEAELRSIEEEKRRKEVYGDAGCPSQEEIDGYMDSLDAGIPGEDHQQQSSAHAPYPIQSDSNGVGFLIKKFQNMEFHALVTHYKRVLFRDPVVTLIAGVLLVLAVTYGPSRAPSIAPASSAPSFSPNNVVTVTATHTPAAYTTTVFTSSPAKSKWPHSPVIPAATVAVNCSIPTGTLIAAEPSSEPKSVLDMRPMSQGTNGQEGDEPSPNAESCSDDKLDSLSSAPKMEEPA
ncbi:hypothetical protein CPC735_009620 [Coccidioides posadasii C735 delta SOWgp]|uniref:Pathway-specific nitrogen regulator n=1 Tax=Coccidioides posadasii (strain C735) TaxID=222929 RepID=C5PAM4_COCP7|nr:hypothetical protein CPC735_009620 [Coccidioides posadasii C735 delta SOWgp]EER26786.1 hypothetical protein CPC735_009620 [Coccidioides posadasii C735 delta SOWgp]|eukprot:XP_003068931.1 hypothetical protein CPC735_009620 [Coccidioides posadasii C735 delta SOWgp]